MAGVGVTVAEGGLAVPERFADAGRDERSRPRVRTPTSLPLRRRSRREREAVVLAPEVPADPSEPGDHLVGEQQHVVSPAEAFDLRPVAVHGRDDTARPDDRLPDEGGYPVGLPARTGRPPLPCRGWVRARRGVPAALRTPRCWREGPRVRFPRRSCRGSSARGPR